MSLWDIRGGFTHGSNSRNYPAMHFSHKISQMHGKLCNSPHKTPLSMHFFHQSLYNSQLRMATVSWNISYRVHHIVHHIVLWAGHIVSALLSPCMLSTFCYSFEDQIHIDLRVPILQLYCRDLSEIWGTTRLDINACRKPWACWYYTWAHTLMWSLGRLGKLFSRLSRCLFSSQYI